MVTIIISGLAGAGKSTLAKKLAEKLKLKYICGGDVLKEIAKEEGYSPTENWWETKEGMEFLKKRQKNFEYDKKLDEKLMKYASQGNCVITSWALPWIFKGNAIKIWLNASQEERARRIAKRDGISYEQALEIVKKRDEENIKLYKNLYGYELGKDLEVFDLIVETDEKTPEQVEKEVLEFLKKSD
ncbi:MAG TPA: cytidylate kinase [Nanoarchaeota archaeon]|nr:cytidylate kinase [Nanoarchaeota archaeon]